MNLGYNRPFGAPGSRDLGVLIEIGVSTSTGLLTSSAVRRNLASSGANAQPASWVRLENTLTRNFPEKYRNSRIGDSRTQSSLLGRSTYFGGVQYGSNFALTPGFIRQPLS